MSGDTSAYVDTLNRFARELAASTPTGVPGFVFIDTPEGKMVQLQFEYEQLQAMYGSLFAEFTALRGQAAGLRDRHEAAEQCAREQNRAYVDMRERYVAKDGELTLARDELLKARQALWRINNCSLDVGAARVAEDALRS